MDDGVVFSSIGNELLLLLLLVADRLLGSREVVFLFLSDFLGFLLVLLLTEDGQTGFLSLNLSKNGLQSIGSGGWSLLSTRL